MDTPVPPQFLGAHFILRERGRQALEITAGLGLLAPTWTDLSGRDYQKAEEVTEMELLQAPHEMI